MPYGHHGRVYEDPDLSREEAAELAMPAHLLDASDDWPAALEPSVPLTSLWSPLPEGEPAAVQAPGREGLFLLAAAEGRPHAMRRQPRSG